MKKGIKRWLAVCMVLCCAFGVWGCPAVAETGEGSALHSLRPVEGNPLNLNCKSAVLMEASTGTVLYEHNADEALPPASVTKVMTLLLVMEAIEAGDLAWEDTVRASAHAASMGGSQIFLKEGEEMTVSDMVKSVVIASANDAAVALAEHVAGSEAAFVDRMNRRAAELGMKTAKFENTNGLDDTAENHVLSARDIAIMSAALIAHPKILEYSSIWMDTIRDGAFGLTNTNRLVRFYRGCTGLKTGSTAKAGFCVSATAERDGMSLVCVIMGADTRDIRNAEAARLLDWGFANYGVYVAEPAPAADVKITGGTQPTAKTVSTAFRAVLSRADVGAVESRVELPESVAAPVRRGQAVGEIVYTCNGQEIGRAAVLSAEEVTAITYGQVWLRMLARALLF